MSIGRIDAERFDGKSDFTLWKRRMLAHLSVLGLKDTLMDPPAIPVERNETMEARQRRLEEEATRRERSDKAMDQIIINIGNYVLRKVEECTTASSLWSTLERLYNSKSLPNRINLQSKFYSFRMDESKNIDENVDSFLKILSELRSASIVVTEEVQAVLLLCALPSQYNNLKEILKHGKETLTIDDVVEAAKSKEDEMKDSGESSKSQNVGEGYFARGRSEKREVYQKRSKARSRSKSGSKLTCWYCKKEGHVKKDCFLRKKRMENGDQGEAAVIIDEIQSVDALMVSSHSHQESWVIDSGCSYHMTSRREWFDTFEEVSTGQVLLGDDRSVSVKGIGTVRINTHGGSVKYLTNVRYLPELKRNLISVGTLDIMGFKQVSENGRTRFYKNGRLALQGSLAGTLYMLDGETVTGQINSTTDKNETELWHRRLGHMSVKNLKILAEKKLLDKKQIKDLDFCENCIMGKNKRLSFNIGKHNSEVILKYIHMDLWGSPTVTPSLSGKIYFLSIIDDHSRKVWVYFLKRKDEAFGKFCDWKKLVENQTGKKVKTVRTDNGLEFCSAEFNSFCSKEGIERHRTCAYTPQQNGVAERMNRTIMEKVRCILDESGLDERFWAEAVATSVYVINRSPSTAIDCNVPEELWLKRRPGYEHLRRFGSVVYIHADQGKLKPRALKGVFLGYPEGVKGYKVWLIDEEKCVISRNVVFTEGQVFKDLKKVEQKDTNTVSNIQNSSKVSSENIICSEIGTSEFVQGGDLEEVTEDVDSSDEEPEVIRQEVSEYSLARDRPRRNISLPARFVDCDLSAFALLAAEDVEVEEPQSFEEAMKCKDKTKWKEAADEEMFSLNKNKTWSIVRRPEKKKVIGCKWVFKLKPGISEIEEARFKGRLVAKGYSQKEGIDYEEIFSPVVKHVSIRLLLSITVNQDLELEQLDVKTAFLHGMIDEEIFMEQPEGYEVKKKEKYVCMLHKALYGLKQAPRMWNRCFDQFITSHGFLKSSFDHCVYYKEISREVYIYLLLYVDDMLLASKDKEEIKKVKDILSSRFEMKDLGKARRILGMDIERDREGGVLTLSQCDYIKKVLKVFKMNESKGVSTPIGSHFKLTAVKDGEEETEMEGVPYANAIGSMMYAMIGTRPDIAYGIGLVSRYMSRPGLIHWSAVKWLLRYLKESQNLKIEYRKNKDLQVEGYCDSDFAADLDKRRSITGHVFTVGGNVVSWKSGLQHVVALSTTEAEYMALVEAVKEGIWLRGLANELGFVQESTSIWCDSQSALCLAKNSVHHERTKHIDTRLHFIRDIIAQGDIKVQKIPTSRNPADILTKGVPVLKFQEALDFLGLTKQ